MVYYSWGFLCKMKKILIALSFVGVAALTSAQVETSITHYQKKATLTEMLFPGSSFNSDQFLISVHDSVYTSGIVTAKKLKTDLQTLKQFSFSFSDQKVEKVVFAVKGKKQLDLLMAYWSNELQDFSRKEIEEADEINISTSRQGVPILIEMKKVKKYYFFSLTKV